MSVHVVYFKDGEKTKYLRPVLNRADYLALRNGDNQQQLVAIQECGTEALDYFAMLCGWGMARAEK